MTGLAKLEQATRMLAEIRTLGDAKQVASLAAAATEYARKAKLGLEAQNHAASIKIKAERKAGEILAKLKRGKPIKRGSCGEVATRSEYRSALDNAKADIRDANRWQQVAAIPADRFESWAEEKKAEGAELSTSGLLREVGREVKRADRIAKMGEIAKGNAPLSIVGKRFPILLCDPPWRYDHCETENRAIENQYPTMTLEEICALEVAGSTTDDAVLYLWSTSPKLYESMKVLDAWGFSYRTCLVWDKEKIGMGYWARQQHELLLVATRGNPPTPAPEDRPASVIRSSRPAKHSEKPVEAYEIIEKMWPTLPKLEMFCRSHRQGWTAWGNQA